MNLNNFKNKISPVIYERGEDYYYDNATADLQDMENGQWFAIVEGNEDYEVDISISENSEIQDYDCNCPYDGEICKHVVAVLLKIKDEMQIPENTGKKAKKEPGWKEIVSNVPENELRKFIKEYAAKNRDFRNNLTTCFSGYDSADNSVKYRQMVQEIFFASEERYGFNDYYQSYETMSNVYNLLRKADEFIEEDNYKEAFYIAAAVAPECIEAIQSMDDSDGECGGAINDSFNIVSKILELSDDETLRNEIFEWILQEAGKILLNIKIISAAE